MKINTINFYEIVNFLNTLTAIMFPVNLCIALKLKKRKNWNLLSTSTWKIGYFEFDK